MKVVQRWKCDTCGTTYDAPMPVSAVYCPRTHLPKTGRGRSGQAPMTLIQGEPVTTRKKKKETPHGKSGSL